MKSTKKIKNTTTKLVGFLFIFKRRQHQHTSCSKGGDYIPMSNVFDPKARFTLGVRAKKLGANFKHFGLVVWPQVIDKCWNIGPKGCKLPSQIQWYPFFSLGANTRP
jgi:hypothetical protein